MRQSENRKNWLYFLAMCAIGLLINFAGNHIVNLLGLPLYLDNIGSALAAALGGYIPGIIVGFLTNFVNGIKDFTTVYYGSLTVMIAVASAWFAQRGYYKRVTRLPIVVLTFALIGGGIGSVLTWMIYGLNAGEGISAHLTRTIYNSTHLNLFLSQFTADMIIDIPDKTLTVLAVALALRLIPDSLKERLIFQGWLQKPLSEQVQSEADHKLVRKMSLRLKIIQLVVAAMLITAVVIAGISFSHFRTVFKDEHENLAKGIAEVIRDSFDHDRVDEFLEKGEAAEGYLEAEAILKHLMDYIEDLKYCYVYRIAEDGCHVVFDPDTDEVPGAEPGEIIPFDESFTALVPKLLAGEHIKPIITDDTYGWLLTVYEPIYDSNGVCTCYVGVDVSMDRINNNGYSFLSRVVSLYFVFFTLILMLAIRLAEYNVILPINSMALTTNRFAFDSEAARTDSLKSIEQLEIRTGDEIENLYTSVVKTTEDMVSYIAQMQKQGEVISRLQSGLIMVLADMVESRDQCTGDHVRKTAAYVDIIMRQLKADGIYADQLTEAFMSDVVQSAPLHDVGKIQVADAILNKPGRLTDEEFEAMKLHTTAGGEVITRAMKTVSEEQSGYLREARNLALYHHEKWNGAGYPEGLKGEEIPLSARIMAVADVFDALVSRRSYKEGFPFEKAMGIIREGMGTHFDPQVAGAFLRAEDEVRRVMNMKMES